MHSGYNGQKSTYESRSNALGALLFQPIANEDFFLIIAGNEKSSKEGDATSRSGEGGLCDGILRGLQFGMLDTNCKCFFSHPLSPTFSCLFIRNICVLETIHRMAVAVINVKGPLFIRMADVGRHRDETQPIHHTVNNLVVWQIFGWEPVQWQIGHAKLVIKNVLKPLTISNLKKTGLLLLLLGFYPQQSITTALDILVGFSWHIQWSTHCLWVFWHLFYKQVFCHFFLLLLHPAT